MNFRGLAIIGAVLLLGVGVGCLYWLIKGSEPAVVADKAPAERPAPAILVPPPATVPANPVAKTPTPPNGAPALPVVNVPATPAGDQVPPPNTPARAGSMTPTAALPGSSSPGAPPTAPPTPEEVQGLAIELDKVGLMLRDYRTLVGSNPVGTNAEIMQAVMGGNPRGARLGPPEGQSLNGQGELVDRWGTPYFFHQLSATSMEIRSAGPDKILWNSDDVVQR